MKRTILILAVIFFSTFTYGQGTATYYDGVDSYIDCSLSAVVLPNTFTQEVWIYIDGSQSGYRGIIGGPGASPQLRPPSLYILNTTGLHFGFGDGTTWNSIELNGDYLTQDQWNHYAVTFDGNYYRLYINGEKIILTDSTFASGEIPYDAPQQYIGWSNASNYFKGKIDEVRLWNTARTLDEIREFMNREIPPANQTGLVAYYKMNDGSGTTATNEITTVGADGTLTNMSNSDWQESEAFNTWIGTTLDWNTTTNWSRDAVPVAEDNVGIYEDATNDPLVTSLAVDVNSVIMGTATSLAVDLESVFITDNHYSSTTQAITIDGELYVENTLQLKGDIDGDGLVYAAEYILGPEVKVYGLTPTNGERAAGGTWLATQGSGGSVNWFDPTNWNQGVPNQNTSVLIDLNENPEFWPEIISGNAECKRLNIYGQGAALNVGSEGNLNIIWPGNANGLLKIVQGTLSITGGTLAIKNIIIDQGNLTIENSGSVQVDENVDVLPGGELKLQTGSTMTIGQQQP